MKVKLPKGYRETFTIADLERAKAVIRAEKEDEETAAGWAVYAVNEALGGKGCCVEVLKAEAIAAGNSRAWNAYGDDTVNTETMDVWIDAIAETTIGFMKVGAYLTDIWRTGEDEYRHHEYIELYKRAE